MDTKDILTIAQTLGISSLCLIALGLGLWRAAVWVALHVVEPIVQRHLKFVDKMEEVMTASADKQKEVLLEVKQLATAVSEIKTVVIRGPTTVEIVPPKRGGSDHDIDVRR